MAATAPILEFDDGVDEILANPDTPPCVPKLLKSLDEHDAKASAASISNIREGDTIREDRADIARMIAAIDRADTATGPLMRERTNDRGITEKIPVDRRSPLVAKDGKLRERLNKVSTAHIPAKIGGPPRKWLSKQRNRPLFAADPVTLDLKKPDAYERAQAKTDAKLANIEQIWNTPRPLAEVLEQIPCQVDKIAFAPRLGELFAGSHTSSHRGKRTIEYPNRRILFELERVRQDASFGESFGTVTSAAALVAWLFRDEMIEKLSDLARTRAKGRKEMSAEEKRAALDAAYLDLEKALRVEIATAFAVEEQTGGIVDIRPCHPAILLGLAADPAAIAEWDPRA